MVLWLLARDVEAKVGFTLGPVVDLSLKLATVEGRVEMPHMFNKTLSNWPDMSLYHDAKVAFDAASSRSFSGSIWDKNQPPHAALRYSTMQGAILYQLYVNTRPLGISGKTARVSGPTTINYEMEKSNVQLWIFFVFVTVAVVSNVGHESVADANTQAVLDLRLHCAIVRSTRVQCWLEETEQWREVLG